MSLTPSQQAILLAHIQSNPDQSIIDAVASRANDQLITDHYNAVSTTDAWRTNVSCTDIFDNTAIAKFDALSAGKRDSWKMIFDMSIARPLDFTKNKLRNGINDVWKNVDTQPKKLLEVGIEKATVLETVFGGAVETKSASNHVDNGGPVDVSAIARVFVGSISKNEISSILNTI